MSLRRSMPFYWGSPSNPHNVGTTTPTQDPPTALVTLQPNLVTTENSIAHIPASGLPRIEVTTVRELFLLVDRHDMLQGITIDILWGPEQQSEYIKELYNNVSAYLFTLADKDIFGKQVPMLVDGYQRLTAITNFYLGEIPCSGPTGAVWYASASEQFCEAFNSMPVVLRRFASVEGQPAVQRDSYRPLY